MSSYSPDSSLGSRSRRPSTSSFSSTACLPGSRRASISVNAPTPTIAASHRQYSLASFSFSTSQQGSSGHAAVSQPDTPESSALAHLRRASASSSSFALSSEASSRKSSTDSASSSSSSSSSKSRSMSRGGISSRAAVTEPAPAPSGPRRGSAPAIQVSGGHGFNGHSHYHHGHSGSHGHRKEKAHSTKPSVRHPGTFAGSVGSRLGREGR